jgi:hypothetical protein
MSVNTGALAKTYSVATTLGKAHFARARAGPRHWRASGDCTPASAARSTQNIAEFGRR